MAKSNTFQEEIENHLIAFKTDHQYLPPTNKKEWLYHDMSDGLFPPIKHGFLQYAYNSGMPLHDFVNHVRSSQMFCINLFYYLLQNEPNVLLKVLGKYSKIELASIQSFEFEFSADSNILGEWKSDNNRPEEYVTATDLYIKAANKSGEEIGYLIEVKFSENEFTKCGGFESKGNLSESKTVCNNANSLLHDFKSCYLHGANGKSKLSRTYLDYFVKSDFKESAFSSNCPFILNHQCLRNQALLRALVSNKKIDRGFFVLVNHDSNVKIIDEWEKYNEILSEDAKQEILHISASSFIKSAENKNFTKYFYDRYMIR